MDFDIRRIKRELSEEDLGAIVSLYVETFSVRVPELSDLADKERERIESYITNDNSEVLVAYYGGELAGLLLAGKAKPGDAVLPNTALESISLFMSKASEFECEIASSRLTAAIFWEMINLRYCMDPYDIDPKETDRSWYLEAPWNDRLEEGDYVKYATAVIPKFEGNGLATQLSEHLEEIAKEKKAKHILTHCSEDPGILQMNRRLGYLPIITTDPWYMDGSPMTLMMKVLERDVRTRLIAGKRRVDPER